MSLLLISACVAKNTYLTTTFYEKFLAEKLTSKLKEQGWTIKENNADYKLTLRFGNNFGLRSVSGIVPVSSMTLGMRQDFYVLTERNVIYKLANKKTGKPHIYGIIRASKDFDNMDTMMLLNNAAGILAEEMKTENAIQQKEWKCMVDISKKQYKRARCSAEENEINKFPHELNTIKDMDFFTPIIEKNKE